MMGICLADLATTLGLLASRNVFEGNPLMKFYLDIGVGMFIAAKLVLIVMPIVVAEYSKQFKPAFVKHMLRLAIIAYVGMYVTLFAGINLAPMAAARGDSSNAVAAMPAR